MEGKPEEGGAGYAEEQPGDVADEGANQPRERREREGAQRDEASEGEDGKATGNPRSAG